MCARMASSGSRIAVDAVLREHESVAALPSAARIIRQFAQLPLLIQLKGWIRSPAGIAQVEQLLTQHSEDLRLDALERDCAQQIHDGPQRLPNDEANIVSDVFMYAAEHGSMQVVEWGLRTSTTLRFYGTLKVAVQSGHLTIVQLLHPRVNEFGYGVSEDSLLDTAASQGHLEILQWLHDNRKKPSVRCSQIASRLAAANGHLEVLKWIHANYVHQWPCVVLQQATLHRQQHVMDWIHKKRFRAGAFVAMKVVAKNGDLEVLAWLHAKYPDDKIDFLMLEALATASQLSVVKWLITQYPERYASHGYQVGVSCGDRELVSKFAPSQCITKRDAKRVMHIAGSRGHVSIIQWFSRRFNHYIPVRILWRALRCGHVGVMSWVVKQRPALLTRERLEEMHQVSLKQPMGDTENDALRVTRWIGKQQRKLGYR